MSHIQLPRKKVVLKKLFIYEKYYSYCGLFMQDETESETFEEMNL